MRHLTENWTFVSFKLQINVLRALYRSLLNKHLCFPPLISKKGRIVLSDFSLPDPRTDWCRHLCAAWYIISC